MRKRLSIVALLASASLLAACTSGNAPQSDSGDGKLAVAGSFYPLAFVAENVGGDLVEVIDLTPAGGSAHELEMSPRQVDQLGNQDLVLYLGGGFQPAVEQAISVQGANSLDALDVVQPDQVRPGDAHIWLNPMIVADIGDETAVRMGELDPAHADDFAKNAQQLRSTLEGVDAQYREQLASCQGATLVTSHEAFGYLADAYGLKQVGITGINPEAEPSPKRLREVEEIAKEFDVTTIFFESTVAEGTAERLASTIGIKTAQLNPMEATPDSDFVTVMETNLSSLSKGLNCK